MSRYASGEISDPPANALRQEAGAGPPPLGPRAAGTGDRRAHQEIRRRLLLSATCTTGWAR